MPHLLSCPICDVPPTPASSLSASVSPSGLFEAQGALPVCLSVILCLMLPPSLCVGLFGVLRVWGNSAGVLQGRHRRGRSPMCSLS